MRGGKLSGTQQSASNHKTAPVPGIAETLDEPCDSRIAAYLRVSTEEQAKSGLGIEAQERQVRAMATVKGWPEPVIYCDDGISGTKGVRGRPQLAALMAAVAAGAVDAVIIKSLDRLGRKTRLILELVDDLNRAGVSLVSCKESLDTTTPTGQFVLTLFAALAQLERDTIAERTRDALAAHGLRDGEKGGKLPFGYVRTERGVRVDRAAAYLVREIFARRAAGASMRAIADALNADGQCTDHGKDWQHSSVREVLSREAIYRGGQRGESSLTWPVILPPTEEGADAERREGAA